MKETSNVIELIKYGNTVKQRGTNIILTMNYLGDLETDTTAVKSQIPLLEKWICHLSQ